MLKACWRNNPFPGVYRVIALSSFITPGYLSFRPGKPFKANDIERKQDFSETVASYHEMQKAHEAFGDELIEVPRWSVAKRAGFILLKVIEALQTP
ncbi:hypothetical protein ACN0IJ_07930 [Shewanella indica]|uniref:hypothetical protein n=1 Tax=Shewanella indica TaxID=768528 RepID=UPI003D364D93